jgi:hypothetical protein
MRHLYKWFLAVLASSWYSIPRACHNCRNEESRLMGLTSARTSGAERVQMPHASCWSSLPARVYRCVVSMLHAHVRPPSASPHLARTPRLHQPLLPLTPSWPGSSDEDEHAPSAGPHARHRAPLPQCPGHALMTLWTYLWNTKHYQHETLDCNISLKQMKYLKHHYKKCVVFWRFSYDNRS